ncbi:P-loop containing nucleoside triphosphate hydrolase superfamily protein [Trifolium repens]|nr:P-loop containing nucleoside triphosphate hydrolase superfamily protein [Trifolium repens]
MEQKGMLISACVGVGVGVGLGLASGQTKWGPNAVSSNAITPEKIEHEMLRLIVDGRESNVTFDNFPYYLSEQTRVLLTSAAYVHLKHAEVSKYTRNLAPASRTILLSGPAELYQQVLAKALAHYFEAKLLLFDVTDFSLKIQSRYGSSNIENSLKRSTSETTLARLSDLFGSFSFFPQREDNKGKIRRQSSGVDLRRMEAEGSSNPSKLRRNASASGNMSSLGLQSNPTNSASGKHIVSWSFDEKLLIQTIYKVLVYVSKTYPIVLYLRDVDNKEPEYRNGKLVIPCNSLSHALGIFQEGKLSGRDTMKLEAQAVTAEQREEGAVVKPEGKSESSAPGIKTEAEIPTSAARTDGENSVPAPKAEIPDNEFEKRIRPEVIPANEIGRTRVGEHEAMRKIKNEFMTNWDGLTSKPSDRILVLAATNRPFDLDEAIIRRFERRIMVGLPSAENRENILRTLLAKEKVDDGLDFKELATMTEGYSGSDLKNICTTAAYRPVRELIQQEIKKDSEKKKKEAEGQDAQDVEEVEQERVISLRPLNMQDFKVAKSQVAASFASEGAGMNELKQWNDLYGEGGSRKKEQLSYFL